MVSARKVRVRPLPRPGRPEHERRKQRSDYAGDALRLALTSSARRADLAVMLIVDEAGLVVAQSDCDLDLQMLAAVTPIVGRGKALPRIRRAGEPVGMSVRPTELLGEQLYLAAVGGDHRSRQRELRGSVAATHRILA